MAAERPSTPWWVFALVVGGAVVVVWWVVGMLARTVGFVLRGVLLALLVGGVVYLVLTAMGRQPGRR